MRRHGHWRWFRGMFRRHRSQQPVVIAPVSQTPVVESTSSPHTHTSISRFSSSSPIFSADAINLLCIPNLQVVFSSAELRAPPSLWFPELAGSWSQTLQLAWNSRDQSGPVETSQEDRNSVQS